MKLTFRNIKKEQFTVDDVDPSEKVEALKQKVMQQQGMAVAPRLIHSGKMLQDDKTVESYNIKESDHIICMEQKPKAAPVAAAPPQTPASTTTAATPAAPSHSSATAAQPPATPSPAGTSAPRDPSMAIGSERAAAIANMESMGFERPQIEAALRAAFNNPERAVEYLLNGIPDNLRQQTSAPPAAAAASPPQPAPGATNPSQGAGAPQGEEPVNLFEAAAAANRGAGGVGGQGPGAAAGRGMPATAGGGTPGQNLDFLRNNPMFQQLRQLVQQQPQMLESVLQQLAASNPQLAAVIAQNPEEFMALLGEGGDGEDAPLPPGAASISVTEEERDAIERLCRLGFERDLVIQAYFACDKNEELAANFLFDHPDDDEDTQRQG